MVDTIKHRDTYNQVGSVGGSLGGSMAASAVLGNAFGFAGSLVGAVGGAILGSRAGVSATNTTCDVVDSVQAGNLCGECQAAAQIRPVGYKNWGGGRLGGDGEAVSPAAHPAVADVSLGGRLSEAASTAGSHVGSAASAAGSHISGAASWVKQSIVGGGEHAKDSTASGNVSAAASSTFIPFSGNGHALGGAAPSTQTQMEEDEALARRLQEEFSMEDQSRSSVL